MSTLKRRRRRQRRQKDSDDSASSSSDGESGPGTTANLSKRRKAASAIVSASSSSGAAARDASDLTATVFAADRSVPITSDQDAATKQSNMRHRDEKPVPDAEGASAPDGTYRGLANQATFIRKGPGAPTAPHGPMKAAANIRSHILTDFTPDVCKDGFCGFGDNCKFLHEREAYEQGWQLDKEWEKVARDKKTGGTVVASADRTASGTDPRDDALPDSIPFACIICEGPYREPCVTRCGHYFCEPCALRRYSEGDPTCAACGADTQGSFAVATKLQKLLEKKKQAS